jgi:hypothetical protein
VIIMGNSILRNSADQKSALGAETHQPDQYRSWLDSLSAMRCGGDLPPSVLARKNIERGRALAEKGDAESALLAFQAALLQVLQSQHPEDRAVRSRASEEVLQLIRAAQ